MIDTNPFDETLNRNSHSDLDKQNKLEQLHWLDKTLFSTTATWKIIIGHHPLFTTEVIRNKMMDVRNAFLPIFEKHKVDFYFASHEHDLQHQKPIGHTHYFVSGAGKEIRPVTWDSAQTKFAISEHGFMSVKLHKDTMNLQVINHLNKIIYKTNVNK